METAVPQLVEYKPHTIVRMPPVNAAPASFTATLALTTLVVRAATC
jgi:hypothetical protein